jgi:hypothetical protein
MSLAAASRLPSGENATDLTVLVWPVSGLPTAWWVAGSQSATIPAALPVAIKLPSGEKATDHTKPEWGRTGGA